MLFTNIVVQPNFDRHRQILTKNRMHTGINILKYECTVIMLKSIFGDNFGGKITKDSFFDRAKHVRRFTENTV